jgi:hypothetical protein
MSKQILLVLNALARFCQTQASSSNDSLLLGKIFKSLEPTDQYSYRTGVLIHAGIKCLSQKDWIEIQCGHIVEEANRLILEAQSLDQAGVCAGSPGADPAANPERDSIREILIGQALVKIGVLNYAQMVSSELYNRAAEYMLKVSGYIVAEEMTAGSRGATSESAAGDSAAQPEGITAQLKQLHQIVDSIIGSLSLKSSRVSNGYYPSGELSFESRVQSETLSEVLAFGQTLINRAVSLSDISIDTATMLAAQDDQDSKNRRKWLVAYAMTAATTAGACDRMVEEAYLAFGNVLEIERQSRSVAGYSDN